MRLDVDFWELPNGDKYVVIDDIDEKHRESVAFFAEMKKAIFYLDNGKRACPLGTMLEYADEPRVAS